MLHHTTSQGHHQGYDVDMNLVLDDVLDDIDHLMISDQSHITAQPSTSIHAASAPCYPPPLYSVPLLPMHAQQTFTHKPHSNQQHQHVQAHSQRHQQHASSNPQYQHYQQNHYYPNQQQQQQQQQTHQPHMHLPFNSNTRFAPVYHHDFSHSNHSSINSYGWDSSTQSCTPSMSTMSGVTPINSTAMMSSNNPNSSYPAPSSAMSMTSSRSTLSTGLGSISIFKASLNGKVELKDHIFISKDCTYRLQQYVVLENWGKDGVLLYKYLDYIFRCQLFDEQIIRVHDRHGGECLAFHTGLQRRVDNEYLYVLLFPNFISKSHKNKQKWRVQFGNISESFVVKQQLVQHLRDADVPMLNEPALPQRTMFAQGATDNVYVSTWPVEVSWEERLITNQDRIHKVIGASAFFDKSRKHLKLTTLIHAFELALEATKSKLLSEPELAVPQGFVDTKRKKYRMELLLPLLVEFEGKGYNFALAVGPGVDGAKAYTVKSVLTLNMAYNNARLVGFVESSWLGNGAAIKQRK